MVKEQRRTEEELKVIKQALAKESEERKNQLKGVIVSSEDVKIDRVIGKGGFGVVNLGSYNDKIRGVTVAVAIKQIQQFDEESIERFRFECFLMKNIRHPNIVELVGVCWDDLLMGCLLELVDNGSLEDWLKKDRMRSTAEKMTWKEHLLKSMTECAMGVQFLHQARYVATKTSSEATQHCYRSYS